jgi:hypothetical protein
MNIAFCSAATATAVLSMAVLVYGLPADAAQSDAGSMGAGHPNLPRGYAVAAYLNCGPMNESEGADAAIRLVEGESHAFPGVDGPVGEVHFDEKAVRYEITGLDPGAEYVLGFTWWDADNAGRMQSVKFGAGDPVQWTTTLPATVVAAFDKGKPTWAHGVLPVTAPFRKDGRLLVAFANERGPNAVVSELQLLKKHTETAKKRVLIVTGDDYPGHVWRETAPELAGILREDPRLEVSVTECPMTLGSPLMSHYDAAVLHFKNYTERLPLGPPAREGLVRFAESGRGVVLVHFACGAFQEWEGFERVAGRVWNPELRGHDPYGAFTVRVGDAEHPVTRGLADFALKDELYTCLDGTAAITVLCAATSKVDQKEYPIAFTVDGMPKAFHCVLGHNLEALGAPGARALYRRAAAWACGLEIDDN